MTMAGETLYLKLDKNMQIKTDHVMLGDIAGISCSTKAIENRVKTLRLPTGQIKGPGRYVFSVLDVIAVVHEIYPELEVTSLGEADFILTVEEEKTWGMAVSWMKTGFVCLLAFFGAAFSIMAFNNDVSVRALFGQLYETVTGETSGGFTLLEVSYCIGVGMGILIFFHHFARRRCVSDPTPLEVEMRTYEDEVDTTMIESSGRNAKKTTK